jgi:hypothetical protein
LPDFTNRANLHRLAQAVHGGLALPATYPVSGMAMFLESSTATPDSTPARRKLLADNTMEVAVLGYTLERTLELPTSDKLAALINDGTATDFVSTKLVSVGLVKPEQLAKLQLGLLPAVPREKLSSVLANNPAFALVPAGELACGFLDAACNHRYTGLRVQAQPAGLHLRAHLACMLWPDVQC